MELSVCRSILEMNLKLLKKNYNQVGSWTTDSKAAIKCGNVNIHCVKDFILVASNGNLEDLIGSRFLNFTEWKYSQNYRWPAKNINILRKIHNIYLIPTSESEVRLPNRAMISNLFVSALPETIIAISWILNWYFNSIDLLQNMFYIL